MNEAKHIWWSGPIGGLGNRLIAIAAARACVPDRPINFHWINDASCPGEFHDLFKASPDWIVSPTPSSNCVMVETHPWEPFSIYEAFNDRLALGLSSAEFSHRFIHTLRTLPFKDEFPQHAKVWRDSFKSDRLTGVHLRRTDRAELHRKQFRAFLLRKQGLNRELPFYLNAMYGLLPEAIVHQYENVTIGMLLRKHQTHSYVLFSDSAASVAAFDGIVQKIGIKKASISDRIDNSAEFALRETSLKGALLELLCLAQCNTIVQSNRASTFSLVAAIIGAKPILTPQTRYPFWQTIEAQTGYMANSPVFSVTNTKSN
ncbi:hypothetical protein [Hyphococcus lacteus]|uniref:Uncharacterized protein n=1 Tax=Hyphococcus lacteus TaxID=3143536 RepID=A0ABV3Z5C6_9PROT